MVYCGTLTSAFKAALSLVTSERSVLLKQTLATCLSFIIYTSFGETYSTIVLREGKKEQVKLVLSWVSVALFKKMFLLGTVLESMILTWLWSVAKVFTFSVNLSRVCTN